MRKIFSFILAFTMILTSFISIDKVYASTSFTDVITTDWFHGNVTEMVGLGIVDGYPDGSFKPQGALTADAFIKMLIIGMGYEAKPSDSTYWADGYIQKAEELKIVDKTFIADYRYNLTREQAAKIITNTIFLKEARPSNTFAEYIKKAILDYHLIADKYKQDMIDCYNLGIMQGNTLSMVAPKSTITRAEATTVILRMLNKDRRLKLDFDSKSISGADWHGQAQTLIAPMLSGKPLNELVDVADIMQKQVENTKSADWFIVHNTGAKIEGFETEKKKEYTYQDWEIDPDTKLPVDSLGWMLGLAYCEFDFNVDFTEYVGKWKPYYFSLTKDLYYAEDSKYTQQLGDLKYYEYFMEYYKEPFYEVFIYLFEKDFDKAWKFFEGALKNTATKDTFVNSQGLTITNIDTIINDRHFYMQYSNSHIRMYISLKDQVKGHKDRECLPK